MTNIRFMNPEGLYNPEPNSYSHFGMTSLKEWVFVAGQGGEDQNGVLKIGFEA
ncbi:hypothetical protein [Neisseria sp. Ec49-e6-T10]|uniref:hypothetical protein n=1 Tax=Neisseria sp. Ec49-e6-T10 TaxID=3140744 RepID=UPI003EBD554E